MKQTLFLLLIIVASLSAGCEARKTESSSRPPPKHEHKPPHGGTPVVLGDEEYHLELVLDPANGKLQAYVLDGHLQDFVRLSAESFEVMVKLPNRSETLFVRAITTTATGEKVGDTALFETQADWLKTTTAFDAVLKALTVKGKKYENVAFNFPKGHDPDAKR